MSLGCFWREARCLYYAVMRLEGSIFAKFKTVARVVARERQYRSIAKSVFMAGMTPKEFIDMLEMYTDVNMYSTYFVSEEKLTLAYELWQLDLLVNGKL